RVRLAGRQGQRAVADDDGGRAVMARIGAERVPRHLRIVMAVVVHEAGRHHPAVGLDGAAGWPGQPPQLHDLSARHSHIAIEGWPAGPLDDATVLDQDVVAHVPRSPEYGGGPARA